MICLCINVLSNSDGVTGCGLVAGMTLVIEQVQSEQVVDVYRTVVKLLRSRQQFIVSKVSQVVFLHITNH